MDEKHKTIQKKHELEQHEVKQVLEFLTRYGKLIGAGLLTASIVVIASRTYASHKAKTFAEAEEMMLNAKTPEQIEEVVNNYKSTPTAPVALLNLAKTHFNNGDTAAARANYERFIADYQKNPLLPQAKFGLAYCSEAEGDFNGAAQQFETFLKDNPEHYLTAPATLSMARCLEHAGNQEASRIILEDFLISSTDSQWAGAAENALQQIEE